MGQWMAQYIKHSLKDFLAENSTVRSQWRLCLRYGHPPGGAVVGTFGVLVLRLKTLDSWSRR